MELADVITKAVMQAVLDAGDRMHDEGSDKVRTMKEIANDIKKRLAGSKAEKEEMKVKKLVSRLLYDPFLPSCSLAHYRFQD